MRICKACQTEYNEADEDTDTDFCSFICWELINCKDPPVLNFLEFVLD
jgi:hypothetical protein